MLTDEQRIESIYSHAGRSLKLCLISEGDGQGRIVEPHAIFTSARGKRLFHCYQVGGYSRGGEAAGWKNIDRASIRDAEVLDAPFECRMDYKPPRPAPVARRDDAPDRPRLRLARCEDDARLPVEHGRG